MPPRARDFVLASHTAPILFGQTWKIPLCDSIHAPLHGIICLEWPTFGNECSRGFARSELGKLLVVGSVRAFYARAKLAKEAKKRQVWDTVGQRKETRYGSLEMSLFCEDR